MALFDNGLKIGTPILLGIGAMILAPVIAPLAASIVKPLVKATIKTGLILVQKGKVVISETAEGFEDITAEVKAELIAERAGTGANPQVNEVS
jgi:hypothetical protein